ncbi:hypothetical protein [Nocardia grenadensis]|uniref:hypothetical protein n=1 Tax=Nocardia grenadensis TaxID=931537 RepID=UPI003D706F67
MTDRLDELRTEFVRLMVEDSEPAAPRADWNQAIFDRERGFGIYINTDMEMVMKKFDKAVDNLRKR